MPGFGRLELKGFATSPGVATSTRRWGDCSLDDFDIRLIGRNWTADEMARRGDLPGRLEMVDGKLCLDEEQRLTLLGVLLEHIGTARAVSLGPLQAWVAAVEQRKEDVAWDSMPAVGVEQFWRPATLRLSFGKRLEIKADMGRRRKRLKGQGKRATKRP